MTTVVLNLPVSSGGGGGGSGDASEAQQIIGNNYLLQINNKTPKLFTKTQMSYNATQDIFERYIGITLTETVTISYTDSSKEVIDNIETT